MYLQEHQPPDSSLQPITERNRKDKLYNDIISFMTSKGLKFNADDVDTFGTKLVWLLCQIFWYIDGHRHVFLYQKNSIVFLDITYQKRRTCNLSIDVLQEFTLELNVILMRAIGTGRDGVILSNLYLLCCSRLLATFSIYPLKTKLLGWYVKYLIISE